MLHCVKKYTSSCNQTIHAVPLNPLNHKQEDGETLKIIIKPNITHTHNVMHVMLWVP